MDFNKFEIEHENILSKIKTSIDMFIYNIKSLKYNLKYGIKNYIYFSKVIWKYRWWDYNFDFQLLLKMYELKEKNWVLNTHYLGDKHDKKDLVIITECLRRLKDEKYFDENIGKFEPKLTGSKYHKKLALKEKFLLDLLYKKMRRKALLWD